MTAATTPQPMALPAPEVHPSAIVDERAELAPGVRIGPGCVVEANVSIGPATTLGPHVVVHSGVRLGARNRIFAHAVLGGEAQVLGSSRDIPSFVEIGDDNILREAVTVHRGFRPDAVTRIGSGNYLMAGAHVAHDCLLGDHIVMANNTAIAGHVHIEDRAFLSGNVAIHQFCRVGRLAMVAGLAKVVQDCLPFVISDGNPARARGLNLIGLRRAGFEPGTLRALRLAYRALLRSGLSLEQALARLEADEVAAVREIARFIRGSTRGFAHEARLRRDPEDS